MTRHILILGGTTEARELAQQLAPRTELRVTLSLAGRTATPRAQAVPGRRGGFGGVAGLVQWLRDQRVDALIDATHPYASTMSAHAAEAAARTGTPLLALCRSPWLVTAGDRWIEVRDAAAAVAALGSVPRNVFLTLGRQALAPFAAAPQHRYLVRSVDPVEPPLAVPRARYLVARGPFGADAERALLLAHAIDVVVAKNSGGAATYGKIAAARALRLPVVLLRRPPASEPGALSAPRAAHSVADVVAWLDHEAGGALDRGV